jgi:hypothetical protein
MLTGRRPTMAGEASWITGIVLLVGIAAVLALWVFGVRMGRYHQWRKRSIVCPGSGKRTDTIMVEKSETGRVVDVARCSAFEDPSDVRCRKQCIEMVNRSPALVTAGPAR